MSYLTPSSLAAEHRSRTARLRRSWGGSLLRRSWTSLPGPRGWRRPVPAAAPVRQVTLARTAATCCRALDEAAVAAYRERVLVTLR